MGQTFWVDPPDRSCHILLMASLRFTAQLGLSALKKSHRPSKSFQRFIEHALERVPDLAEPVVAMAIKSNYLTQVEAKSLSIDGSCDDV